MRTAYIDTSFLIPNETCQPDFDVYEIELGRFERLVSQNLLEAEYRSVCTRERRAPSNFRLNKISRIIPARPLTRELESVMTASYLRGADLWHVANTVGFGVRLEIFGMTGD